MTLFEVFQSYYIYYGQTYFHCLENVIFQYGDSFFHPSAGIISGDNHSMSLANITLHFVILRISKTLHTAELFKRFIDDIVWLSYDTDRTNKIKNVLTKCFSKHGMEITFRQVSTNAEQQGAQLKFLDVNHVIGTTSLCGFYTRDYVKPTAVNRGFLHGKSHHPPNTSLSL